MTPSPSATFWRVFGAALTCYLAIFVVRAIRADSARVAVLCVILGVVLFVSWASRFPRAASATLGYLNLVGAALAVILPSSEPLVLHIFLGLLALVAAYLAFRARRVAAYESVEPQMDQPTLDRERSSEDP
jgi:hypothetical protein